MAKRISISPEQQYQIIGIASAEPIWKICWECNRCFQLALRNTELPHLSPKRKTDKEVEQTLFDMSEWENDEMLPSFYEDTDSFATWKFYLLDNDTSLSPKETHIYPYIFLIVYEFQEQKPDIERYLLEIRKWDSVISADMLIKEDTTENFQKKLHQWLNYLV